MILLKIYIACVFWSVLYVFITGIWVNSIVRKGRSSEKYKNNSLYIAVETWRQGPFLFKIVALFCPVVNLIFDVLCILVLISAIRQWWYNVGKWVCMKFSGPGRMKHFIIKSWIIRHIFSAWESRYYDACDKFLDDQVLLNVIKQKKHERSKQEVRSESECDSVFIAAKGIKEAPEKEVDNCD
jgi:hypothetical protein